ncbi:putative membrane protein [Geodermatophilus normandii]|uniref:Putative membrane protein n=1 Tax=Geodermatophilus normandii TaxID=1137989 RepID=A0A317QNF0_9ACTN|nr:EamA family transporter [Geodermatophilus normandii]PWW24483.1 putative membrane protein [Geodermatophilus normandii]
MAMLLALASAVVYGMADFAGGLASRRATAAAVVALSQAAGLVAVVLLLPWLGGDPAPADLAWGAAAGVAGGAGLLLFYRSLADGVMSVVAPVTAVAAAALPVLGGLLLGERIGPLAAGGIVLALAAVVLVAAEGGLASLRSARLGTVAPALAAGAGFGLFFVVLDRTGEDSGLSPLVAARVVSVLVIGGLALASGRALRVSRRVLPVVVLAGVGDMTANALFLVATQVGGQLAITGVLASLYPASTVLLAQVVLRERLAGAQRAGLAVAAAAVVLIALPS